MDDNSSRRASDPARLFIYGTLRAGSRNARSDLLMPGTRPEGSGRTRGQLIDLGDYPGLVAAPAARGWVRGELHALLDAPAVLERLDRYEGCAPGQDTGTAEFERVAVNVVSERGTKVRAWVYVYCGSAGRHRRIISGDYLEFGGGRG